MYLGTAVGFDCPSALGLDKKKARRKVSRDFVLDLCQDCHGGQSGIGPNETVAANSLGKLTREFS